MTSDNLPYSVPLSVKTIHASEKKLDLVPSPEQRAEIAKFLDINGIPALSAALNIAPWRENGVKVTGNLTATVELTCVVSNEVFPFAVNEAILMHCSPDAANAHDENVTLDDLLNEDEDSIVDPIINGQIDLGQIVTEFLALGLPPFPRKPGLVTELENEETAQIGTQRPFEALSELANKLKK